jgi:hypothetical protein
LLKKDYTNSDTRNYLYSLRLSKVAKEGKIYYLL